MTPLKMADQPCGNCQACCEVVGVHELSKPPFTKCQYQCASGCGIYVSRPPSCASYSCLYQGGLFRDMIEMRPDKLGIIFDSRTEGSIGDFLNGWETREGAVLEEFTAFTLMQLAKTFVILLRRYNSTQMRLIGPPEKLALINNLYVEV